MIEIFKSELIFFAKKTADSLSEINICAFCAAEIINRTFALHHIFIGFAADMYYLFYPQITCRTAESIEFIF